MKWLHHSIILSVMMAGFLWLAWTPPSEQKPIHFPWQIKLLAGGNSQVFGLILNQSQLQDALNVIGNDISVAIFNRPNKPLALEAYYSHFQTGAFTAKLVIQLALDQSALESFYDQYAVHREPIANNGFKVAIDYASHPTVLQAHITGLAYSPSARLEAQAILARFGKPARKVKESEDIEHWLYPEKGLSIALNQQGKALLQYVAPADFQRLDALVGFNP